MQWDPLGKARAEGWGASCVHHAVLIGEVSGCGQEGGTGLQFTLDAVTVTKLSEQQTLKGQ